MYLYPSIKFGLPDYVFRENAVISVYNFTLYILLALMLAKLCSLVSIWKSFAAESLFSTPLVALAFELDPLQVSPHTGVGSITVVAMAAMQKFFQAPAHDST